MATDLGRLTAALADRYRIQRELGRGGMRQARVNSRLGSARKRAPQAR
jgi:Trp operon repressor